MTVMPKVMTADDDMTKTKKARPDDDDSDNLDDKLMSNDSAKDHWSTDDWPFNMGRGQKLIIWLFNSCHEEDDDHV